MSRGNFVLFALGIVLMSLAGAPFLIPLDGVTEQFKAQHAEQIASLSQSDRTRVLEKNFPVFRELPETTQVAYIDLHNKLELDRRGNGNVSQTLDTYDAWLKTLKPYQREELQKTSDPLQRLDLMRGYVQEQQEARALAEMQSQQQVLQEMGMHPQFVREVPALSSEALSRVMTELEAIVGSGLAADQVSRLKDLTGMERWLELLRIVKERNLQQRTGHFLSLPAIEDMHRLVAVIEDSQVQQWMNEEDFRKRGFKWHTLLQKGMFLEFDRQHRNEKSNADSLRKSFDALSKEEQEELLGHSASDFVDLLTQQTQEQGAHVTRQDIREVFTIPRGGPPGRPLGPAGRFPDPGQIQEMIRNADKSQDGQLQRDEISALPDPFRQMLIRILDEKQWDSISFEKLQEFRDRLQQEGGGGPPPNGGPQNGPGRRFGGQFGPGGPPPNGSPDGPPPFGGPLNGPNPPFGGPRPEGQPPFNPPPALGDQPPPPPPN